MRRLALLLLAAGAFGCEETAPIACPAFAVAGLTVAVSNAVTAQPICDATVTAREGDYSEPLSAQPSGSSCTFVGALERPGTYVVSASRAGFVPMQKTSVPVVMGGGDCPHVVPTRVKIELTPEG
jgi:hypothetical protein